MTRFASFFARPVLLLALLAIAGCGSRRQLQSVTVSPATADAQSFANCQVPFKATGTFSKPPSPAQLTSQDVLWCAGSNNGVCDGNINSGVNVDQTGVAQCNSGFVGTVTILAGRVTTMGIADAGGQLKPFGAAQLTCP